MTIATRTDDTLMTELSIPVPLSTYQDTLGSEDLQEKALGARNESFAMQKFINNYMVKFCDKFYEAYEQCIREFGPKQGKAKFNSWIKCETFGIPKDMLGFARDFSPWFRNLEKSLQGLIFQKVSVLNINILKKLIKIPPNLIEELLASSEKLTLTLVNKVLAAISPHKEKQLKLRKRGYAQVITPGHRLEGKTGQIAHTPDEQDNIFLQFFPDGPEEAFKISDVKPVSKPVNQEIDEKEQKLQHYETVIESGFLQQEDLVPQPTIRSEEEIEKALLAKLEKELERKKAEEIALIQADVDERVREKLHQREQEIEQREQQLQQREQEQKLREKQQEEARIQAQQLELAQAEAKQWQERVQHLEKALSKSQNVQHENLDEYEVVTTDNNELVKQVEFLLENNAALERELAEQKTVIATSENSSSEIISEPENLEVLTEGLSAALELCGIRGWGPDGYCAKNKRTYSGSMAIKAFVEDEILSNNQPPEKQENVTSSVRFADYSSRISTPA